MSWGVYDNRHLDGSIQTVPEDDFIEHEMSIACVCGPSAELINGYWCVVHDSLDGRELDEHDYEAPE